MKTKIKEIRECSIHPEDDRSYLSFIEREDEIYYCVACLQKIENEFYQRKFLLASENFSTKKYKIITEEVKDEK